MDVPGPPPHGGTLVDLRVDATRAAALAVDAARLPRWELTRRQRCDLELLATGGFSPLRTFLGRADYESVCRSMRLTSGELWPVPVTLDLPETVVESAWWAGGLTLRARGVDLGILWLREVWRPDREAEAAAVFGTTDPAHPGVHGLLSGDRPCYASGPLEIWRLPAHQTFRGLRHTPAEVRCEMADRGWDRVVAFQTRNPMHRAHQELTVRAARDLDANLLLHPVVGVTKPGDVDPFVRVRCYRALLPTYPDGTVLLSLLPLAMRMAGPREALWHAIVRKNHGATHLIVGRDHAGPGVDSRGRPFYDPYAAQDLVRRHERELGIGLVAFPQMVYVRDIEAYLPEDEVRPGQECLRISGTEQRRRLADGTELPAWFTPPEVAGELRRAFPPRSGHGVWVRIRSECPHADRVAAAVATQLRESGRTVTLLDGSVACPAGAVADLAARLLGEVVRNGGVVVCSDAAAGLPPPAGPGDGGTGSALVLELSERDGSGPVESLTPADDGPVRLYVPRDAAPELVGELVCAHLAALGYLRPVIPTPTPAAVTLPSPVLATAS